MSQATEVRVRHESGKCTIDGELTLITAGNALALLTDWVMSSQSILTLDLAEVTRSDSAGVAILIHCLRLAKQQNKQMTFYHVPEQMMAIGSASGVNEILPIVNNN